LKKVKIKQLKESLKQIVDKTDNQYKIFTGDMDLPNGAAMDFGLYTQRRFAAFNNKKFKFNPLLENDAFDWFRAAIKNKEPGFENVLKNAEDTAERIVATKNLKGAERSKALTTEIDKQVNILAKNKMLNLKQLAIKGNVEPNSLFFGVGKALGMSKELVKEKGLPDAMKKLLSIEDGRTLGELTKAGKTVAKDVETFNPMIAAIDVVLNQSKQMHGKRVFDAMLREGLDLPGRAGIILDEAAVARKGLDTAKGSLVNLKNIKELGRRVDLDDVSLTSELFDGRFFAAPEVANALVGAKELTASLYGLPGYKSLMTLKAGAQISKTILSPMTQVRNFTTASFFPLASGLIGGKVGFKDAWRLTAGDIFQGAKTDKQKLAKIENLINRGVIDQNINVQEMKRVLEKAKDGKITFNTLMNTRIMQKLTDVYQGADNFWKIYSDNFYQGALKTAFGNPETLRIW
jgi:hypothetical protein